MNRRIGLVGFEQNFRRKATGANPGTEPFEEHPTEMQRKNTVPDRDQAHAHRGGDMERDGEFRHAVKIVTCAGSEFSRVMTLHDTAKPEHGDDEQDAVEAGIIMNFDERNPSASQS